MSSLEFASVDDYERFLSATIEAWTPEQRAALAAAMAERWLHAYDAFATAEHWGDPARLRSTVDAVWTCAAGRPRDAANLARHRRGLHDVTPHMDDFDAPEALAVTAIVSYALECVERSGSTTSAVWAMLSGFEAVSPDCLSSPDENPGFWKKASVRKELAKQLNLVQRVATTPRFDRETIDALRRAAIARDLIGEVRPRKKEAVPAGATNQALFEQYRQVLERDIQSTSTSAVVPGSSGPAVVGVLLAAWLGRYGRRKQIIEGEYGKFADTCAQRALVEWQKAQDAAEEEMPTWSPEVRDWLDVCFTSPHNRLGVRAVDEPHSHGPSIRRLWLAAKRRGESDDQVWSSIIEWSRHRPSAWAIEDRRKKKKGFVDAPALGERLARQVTWNATGDVYYPWAADVDGVRWQVGLNDFPDDYMYGLLVGGEAIGKFNDWPASWQRSPTP